MCVVAKLRQDEYELFVEEVIHVAKVSIMAKIDKGVRNKCDRN